MQNAAFASAKIDAHYMPLSISPDRIRPALRGLKSAGFSGFNVTVPYKQTVLPFLDRVFPEARLAGAVNTIVLRESKWLGHNTDGFGFQMLLRQARIAVKNARVLLVGAGGAARAVVYALLPDVRNIFLQNRTQARARALRNSVPSIHRSKIILVNARNSIGQPWDLVINSTSLGLKKTDPYPVDPIVLKHARAAVDLIYNPPVTPFLKIARKAGCRTANGLDMLLYQGARSFELWTGRRAPVRAMRGAILKHL